MIGYLRGKVVVGPFDGVGDDSLTLDVNGVGYELICSSNTLGDVLERGDEVRLWVQTQLREDSLTLFGFSTALEKKMFNSLLKVNGVGPKMAIKILSGATLDQLSAMIEAGDVKALSGLPKVGKKTAEQLILALKGKLVMLGEEKPSPKTKKGEAPQAQSKFVGNRGQVMSALINLGFRLQEVEPVIEQLPEEIEIEQGIRRGLQALSGSF